MHKLFNRQKKIEKLRIKHTQCDLSLKKEYKKLFYDNLKILKLKKQKLRPGEGHARRLSGSRISHQEAKSAQCKRPRAVRGSP